MNQEDLKLLREKLKQGDYDGTDIMKAWIALDELIELKNKEPEQVQISWDGGKNWESMGTPQQVQNYSEDFSGPSVFRGLYPGPVCTDPFAIKQSS